MVWRCSIFLKGTIKQGQLGAPSTLWLLWSRIHVWLLCSVWPSSQQMVKISTELPYDPPSFCTKASGVVGIQWWCLRFYPGEWCPRKRTVVEKTCMRYAEQIQAPSVYKGRRLGSVLKSWENGEPWCRLAALSLKGRGSVAILLNSSWWQQSRQFEIFTLIFRLGILERSPNNKFLKFLS